MAVSSGDGAGRLVTGLTAQDFEVMDRGIARPVQQVDATHDADARLALLVDSSGTCRNRHEARAHPPRVRQYPD